ncbi:pre-rRNA-processing protein esf1 [Phlyctochytrium bullatum]|nr:pre-rRNA-processing protein esf1 [Phlyctochytrium bullatum]
MYRTRLCSKTNHGRDLTFAFVTISEKVTRPPPVYVPADFVTNALQHSKVKLTWDEDDPERVRMIRRKFTKDDLKNMDFKAYIASSSEESDGADQEVDSDKYRSLLNPGGGEDGRDDRGDDDIDMEITFTPGLSEAVAEKLAKKQQTRSETVFESRLRQQKEKRKLKSREKQQETVEEEEDSSANDEFFEGTKKKPPKKSAASGRDTKDAALELLLINENESSTTHFDMRGILIAIISVKFEEIVKKEKMSKRKKRKANVDFENTQDEFEINARDPRFAEALTSHLYAIDPTNPKYLYLFVQTYRSSFKKTKAMEKLLQEKRNLGGVSLEKSKMPKEFKPSKKGVQDLVNEIKRKSSKALRK